MDCANSPIKHAKERNGQANCELRYAVLLVTGFMRHHHILPSRPRLQRSRIHHLNLGKSCHQMALGDTTVGISPKKAKRPAGCTS